MRRSALFLVAALMVSPALAVDEAAITARIEALSENSRNHLSTIGWFVIATITGAEECERRGWTFRSTTIDNSWRIIRYQLTGLRGVDDQLITDLHDLAKSRLELDKVTEEACQATLQMLADAGVFGGY